MARISHVEHGDSNFFQSDGKVDVFFSKAPLVSMVFQWFCRHGTIDKPDHLTIRTGTIMYLTIDFNGF